MPSALVVKRMRHVRAALAFWGEKEWQLALKTCAHGAHGSWTLRRRPRRTSSNPPTPINSEPKPKPGAAQEAAPYKQDPEVLAMTNLVAAYQANDILGFEKILRTNRRGSGLRV